MARILVVEDEPDIREMVAFLLEMEGHVVAQVATGEEAILAIADADVVLLDIRLPGMSGLDVVATLGPVDRRRVLFMSAHQDMDQDDIAARLGCAGFLVKPFEFDDLFARVTELAAT